MQWTKYFIIGQTLEKKTKSMKIEDIVNIGPKTRGLRKRDLIFKTRLFSIS